MKILQKLIKQPDPNKSNLANVADNFYNAIGAFQKLIIALIIIVVALVGTMIIANIINPDVVIFGAWNTVSFGKLTLTVTDEFIPSNTVAIIYNCIEFLLLIAFLVYLCYFLKTVKNILKPISEEKAFTPVVSKNVEKLALVSGIMCFFINFIYWLELFTTTHFYNLEQILINENITSYAINYSFDPTFAIIGCVLIFISYIFKHGENLQQLSDETV